MLFVVFLCSVDVGVCGIDGVVGVAVDDVLVMLAVVIVSVFLL